MENSQFCINDVILCIITESIIDVQIEITADHLGFFEFKVCANDNFDLDPPQSCFDRSKLFVRVDCLASCLFVLPEKQISS